MASKLRGGVRSKHLISNIQMGYNNLTKEGCTHKVVFVSSSNVLPQVHILISNAKRFILGTYHGINNKHLSKYLAEYCYCFNRRFWESPLFGSLLNAVIKESPASYVELTK
ncbi:MAG: transposase [Desulfobacteraceae bacterium]|nr:transposase [Desulfobacteraceae bacterium]